MRTDKTKSVFSTPRIWLSCSLFTGVMIVSMPWLPCIGQETGIKDGVDDSQTLVQSLQQIDRDYVEFLNKRQRIQESYQAVFQSLRESEQDLQRIGNEAIRQQLAAMQARLASLQADAMMAESRRRADGLDNSGNRPNAGSLGSQNRVLKNITQQGLAIGKTRAELEFTLRNAELQQLDAASQAVVRRRLENFQRAQALEQEFRQWMVEWPKFLDRYWPYSDFDRTWNVDQIQQAIKSLSLAHQENLAAMLTCARLKCRVGLAADALALVEKVIDADTSLQAVATAIKAEVLIASRQEVAAKTALQLALKLGKDNLYVRWIRAEILADQKQYNVVEPLWRGFLNHSDFEIAARKRLAILYFNRALSVKGKKGDSDFLKGVKEAELALELEAKPSWHSHLVYGVSLYGVGKNEQALEQIAKAKEKASFESLELCQQWEQRVRNGEAQTWRYFRIFESE